MLNIQGVNIDLKKKKISVYKNILWFSIPKVFDLSDYKTIYITKKRIVVYQSEYEDYSSESYNYYYISLTNETNDRTVVLAESQSYKKIVNSAKRLSVELDMEVKQNLVAQKG